MSKSTEVRRAAEARLRTAGLRPALPRGRAVFGGLLIAAAALSVLLLGSRSSQPTSALRIVARHDLNAGHRIGREDVDLVQMRVPSDTDAQLYQRASDVIGQVTQHSIRSQALLQRGDFAPTPATGSGRRVALSLTPAQALGGAVDQGDVVDVVSSGPDVDDGTAVVARSVQVLAVQQPNGQLGATDVIIVTLALDDEAIATSVIDGSLRGTITLIATQGGPPR